jgi:lipopolysaccharide transport system ATP-binding protein
MTAPIIRIEGLGKRYRISHQGERQRYVALRDVLAEKAKGVAGHLRAMGRRIASRGGASLGSGRIPDEDFWALRGVSYDVEPGEVLGVIGRNGAGKTTLLKILSRITEPTEGRVRLRGRVASLLEVGTGFHPELTGRENIFLNGAILGMTRSEIRRKFDEIVEFAEVERFLDTPVKRYSSGMYVRLAFAVAAHLEPEILIVDEVLAVGDAQFQKRCLGKMRDVAHSGRTVLFVSHNMTAVSSLCSSAIWLSNGSVIGRGKAKDLVQQYLSSVTAAGPEARFSRRNAGQDVRVERVDLLVDGAPASHARCACTIGSSAVSPNLVSRFR